jgi:hypothetical protein
VGARMIIILSNNFKKIIMNASLGSNSYRPIFLVLFAIFALIFISGCAGKKTSSSNEFTSWSAVKPNVLVHFSSGNSTAILTSGTVSQTTSDVNTNLLYDSGNNISSVTLNQTASNSVTFSVAAGDIIVKDATGANTILTNNKKTTSKGSTTTKKKSTASAKKETNSKNKEELTTAADTIIKIIGNKSILINQFNVENFSTLWKTMKPLMKPQYRDESENTLKIKQDLLDLVIRKENVGEFCWYLYTGILISSIVYYNLASKGCPQDVTAINNQQKIYLNKQEENKKNEKLKNKTVYSS